MRRLTDDRETNEQHPVGATFSTSTDDSRPELPSRVHRSPRPDRRRGHRTSPRERIAVVVVAAGAAVAGAFAPIAPTAFAAVDALWSGAFAGVVALAASRARRWTWLVLSGLAAVVAPSGPWLVLCAVAVAGAFAATLVPRRRIHGALVGAVAVQGLLRATDVGVEGTSWLLVAIAVVPTLASAYAVSPRRVRKKVHVVALGLGAFVLVAGVLFAIAAALSYSSLQAAEGRARDGLSAAGDGDGSRAAGDLREAERSFASANGHLGAWWASPIRVVPFAASQAEAVIVSSREGEAVARASAGSIDHADVQQLKYEKGRLDVARLRALEDPLRTAADAVEQASTEVAGVRKPWLVGPIATRVDAFERQLTDTLPQLELGAEAARVAPRLLGADRPTHYLVLFTQPSEARGLGGFVGNWVELTADDGRITVTNSGRASDINEIGDRTTRTITSPPVPADYVSRYGRFRPATYFQDVTLSPDLPSVAAAAAQIYEQTIGTTIDGVMVVDPYALASLLELTGPISVPGAPVQLTSDNAADLLVRRQYTDFLTNDLRKDFLDEASRQVFDELSTGSLPGPRKLAEVLGPMVGQHRLLFHAFDPDARSLLDQLGVDGAFVAPTRSDYFQVVTQNNANNKIDLYLHRSIDYDASYDPASGALSATMTVTLHNDAPAEGLPPSVIGSNDQGLPPGTNRAFVSVYSPLGLGSADLDGHQVAMEYQRELGAAVYSKYVTIAPGASVTLTLHLAGTVDMGPDYRLEIGNQPLVNRDQITTRILSLIHI